MQVASRLLMQLCTMHRRDEEIQHMRYVAQYLPVKSWRLNGPVSPN